MKTFGGAKAPLGLNVAPPLIFTESKYICENDILIVDVVSDWEELTYVNWSDSIKEYLVIEGLWDILEDEDDEDANTEDDEDANTEDDEDAGAEDDEDAGADDDEVAGAEARDWIEKNAKALYLIMKSCGSKRFSLISNIDSAKDAWRALRDAHDVDIFWNSLKDPGSYSSPLRIKYTCSIILK